MDLTGEPNKVMRKVSNASRGTDCYSSAFESQEEWI